MKIFKKYFTDALLLSKVSVSRMRKFLGRYHSFGDLEVLIEENFILLNIWWIETS